MQSNPTTKGPTMANLTLATLRRSESALVQRAQASERYADAYADTGIIPGATVSVADARRNARLDRSAARELNNAILDIIEMREANARYHAAKRREAEAIAARCSADAERERTMRAASDAALDLRVTGADLQGSARMGSC